MHKKCLHVQILLLRAHAHCTKENYMTKINIIEHKKN